MMDLDYWVQAGLADWAQNQETIAAIHRKLMDKEDAYTGWVDWPLRMEPALNYCNRLFTMNIMLASSSGPAFILPDTISASFKFY